MKRNFFPTTTIKLKSNMQVYYRIDVRRYNLTLFRLKKNIIYQKKTVFKEFQKRLLSG